MEEKILAIKEWLDTGSINIFGLPMSGKDTVGMRLAELLGAHFLSSGMIIRQVERELSQDLTGNGALIPTNQFYDIVLPYFDRAELKGSPLVLSSVGRWSGEEVEVVASAERGGHPIKAVVLLDITENEARARRATAVAIGDRGVRADDASEEIFETRLAEFREKTLPVLQYYREHDLLVTVDGVGARDAVFSAVLAGLNAISKER